MRYLKPYKILESWNRKLDDNLIISELEDICLELNDMNIITQCQHNKINPKHTPMSNMREHISVVLENTNSDYSEYIEDVVLRILEFMNSNGWKPSYFIFDGEAEHTEFVSFSKIIDWFPNKMYHIGLKIDFIRK